MCYLQSAIRLKPEFTDAYNNMASALVQKGLIPQAMECYMQALRLDSSLVFLLPSLFFNLFLFRLMSIIIWGTYGEPKATSVSKLLKNAFLKLLDSIICMHLHGEDLVTFSVKLVTIPMPSAVMKYSFFLFFKKRIFKY